MDFLIILFLYYNNLLLYLNLFFLYFFLLYNYNDINIIFLFMIRFGLWLTVIYLSDYYLLLSDSLIKIILNIMIDCYNR